jgi:hypothetical protein
MHTIAEVTQALTAGRYEWPSVPVEVEQHGTKSVTITVDLRGVHHDTFIVQFGTPFIEHPAGLRARLYVGVIGVDLVVRLEPNRLEVGAHLTGEDMERLPAGSSLRDSDGYVLTKRPDGGWVSDDGSTSVADVETFAEHWHPVLVAHATPTTKES